MAEPTAAPETPGSPDPTPHSATPLRDAVMRWFVDLGVRRPAWVLAIVAVLAIIGGVLGSRLEIQTSRYQMVSSDDPYQQRLDAFFAKFGYPDPLVLLVQGGDVEARRAVVDALELELAKMPTLERRVLARVDVDLVAEVLFLQAPDALSSLRASLPANADLAETLEAGVPGFLRALKGRIEATLDGTDAAPPEGTPPEGTPPEGTPPEGTPPAAPPPTAKQADEELAKLGAVATLLRSALEGASDEALGTLIEGSPLGRPSEGAAPAASGAMEADSALRDGLDDKGYLQGSSGEFLVVAIFPRLDGADAANFTSLADGVRETRDRALANARAADPRAEVAAVEVLVTGLPVLTVDEDRLVVRGMRDSGIATAVAVYLTLLVAYRSFRQSLFALLPLGLGVIIATGAVALLVGHLNSITSACFAILLGLGIDFSVHLLARYQEALKLTPDDRATALRVAFTTAGPGVITGALTTVVAFLSLLRAEFTTFAELGINTAVGLGVVLLVTFLLLPIGLVHAGKPRRAPAEVPGLRGLARFVRAAAPVIGVVALVATVASLVVAPTIHFNNRYFDFLPTGMESSRALDILERDGGVSPNIAYATAADLDEARARTKALREQEAVGNVQSPTDLLPPLDATRLAALRAGFAGLRDPDFTRLRDRSQRSGREVAEAATGVADLLDEVVFAIAQQGQSTAAAEAARDEFRALAKAAEALPDGGGAAVARLEERLANLLGRAWTTARAVSDRGHYVLADVPDPFRVRHEAADGSDDVALFVFPRHNIWDPVEAKRFTDAVSGVDPNAAGHAISMHVHNQMIRDDFRDAAILAAILVSLLVFADFRRPAPTLLAFTPVAVGATWMFGIMALTGMQLNVANVVVLPLVLGIGIDAGVHLVHRWQQSAAASADGVADLDEVVAGTGGAVLVAAVTTMLGFAGLLIPDHGGMRSLGSIMVLGCGCALLASLIVLPSLLVLLRRAR